MPSRLALPSRGRPTSGFASCRPPLMSNVRPRASQMRSMLGHTVAVHRSAAVRGLSLYRLVKRHMRCSGAGRPSFGGQRTVSSCKRFLQHRFGLSVLRRPAHQRFGSENMHRPNGGVFSSRAFAGAENEPLAVLEFTESRSNARGKHEHEHRPWFAQRCRHWRTRRAGCKASQNQGKVCALTREA